MTTTAVIRSLRGSRLPVAIDRPQAVWDEIETVAADRGMPTRVMILTGGECRFTCSMCDLWRHTLPGPTPAGSLPEQIRHGLAIPADEPGPPRWIKLYNGSNFFDHRSVPREDLPAIASLVAGFERVVVENHPRLCGDDLPRFRDRLSGRLEVAMGLETAEPEPLAALNKQMTLDDFAIACERLRQWEVDLRAFVLLGVPGVAAEHAVDACLRAVAFALDCGVRHVSIVPLRSGNGWIDARRAEGSLRLPSADELETALEQALETSLPSVPLEEPLPSVALEIPLPSVSLEKPLPSIASNAGRDAATVVTVDLWDFLKLAGSCEACREPRQRRLAAMNLAQRHLDPLHTACGCRP